MLPRPVRPTDITGEGIKPSLGNTTMPYQAGAGWTRLDGSPLVRRGHYHNADLYHPAAFSRSNRSIKSTAHGSDPKARRAT
jgi:hypothetical protein